MQRKDDLTKEYYNNLLNTKKDLLEALPKELRNKIKETKKEIKYLEEVIN